MYIYNNFEITPDIVIFKQELFYTVHKHRELKIKIFLKKECCLLGENQYRTIRNTIYEQPLTELIQIDGLTATTPHDHDGYYLPRHHY